MLTFKSVQIAFQYSLSVHRAPANDEEAALAINGEVHVLQRRLRILTVAPSVAKSHDSVYAGAQLEPAMALLTRKVLHHSVSGSPAEARVLLQVCSRWVQVLPLQVCSWQSQDYVVSDVAVLHRGAAATHQRACMQEWLVIFLARWHHHARKLPFGESPQPGRLDVQLTQAPHLAAVPRIVYALLRCPLLAAMSPLATDAAAAKHALWTCLDPESLMRAIHPVLVAFDDPEGEQHTTETLSRAFLASGKGSVLMMDAYDCFIVMYRAAAAQALPFPPPAKSALRGLVRKLTANRGIAPEVCPGNART